MQLTLVIRRIEKIQMLKLYKLTEEQKSFWETWDNEDGSHTVHWGELGTQGNSKIVKSSFLKSVEDRIQKAIDH